jgi:dynein heavy chain 2
LGKDPVSLYLRNEIENFREVFPLLKYIRGDSYTPDHWHEMYNLLGMPRGIATSDLTFGSFVVVFPALLKKGDLVKELHARAQGEVTIREALQELRTWAMETEFTLVPREDNGRVTSLIRDWKELMTQVGDNQSLLASLKDSPYYKVKLRFSIC